MQDALITILSEKTLPIPELDDEVQAVQGFNVIATANDRDRGVNELSSAMRRRFNTVVLPLPDTADEEVEIVTPAAGRDRRRRSSCRRRPSALEEIRRVVTIFRELRSGVTEDGRTKLKSPSGTLSTAEAISVVTNGLALAAHFGDGTLSARGRRGRPDRRGRPGPGAGQGRLAGVPRGGRARARRLGRAVPGLPGAVTHTVFGIRHHGPGRPARSSARSSSCEPDTILIEGPPEADALLELAARRGDGAARRAAHLRAGRAGPRARSIRSRASRPSGARSATRSSTTSRCASATCPRRTSSAARGTTSARAACAPTRSRALAEIAGHGDPERWWEDVVESAREGGAFEAVTEAMAALREAFPDDDPREEQREAYMRQQIRRR